ncbi:hypothetical protein MCELHM10_04148 [Paracoccaceae bacterium]|jgi:hypothetical protein
MSTRAQIGPEEWANVYVDTDGYPAHMLPALASWKQEDILTAREIRQVIPETLDCFSPPVIPASCCARRENSPISTSVPKASECTWCRGQMRYGPCCGRPECNRKVLILLGITYADGPIRAMLISPGRCNSPGDPAMTTRRATDNSKALDAFMTAKAQINAMLERLKTLSDEHVETHPDEINRGDVGTLNHYANLLRQITDAAFKEGEHAA